MRRASTTSPSRRKIAIEVPHREGDDREAEMWEIAENLHRCDLTKTQRDIWVRRYAELLDSQGLSFRETPGGKQIIGTASRISDETGLAYSTIRRILAPPKAEPAPAAHTEAAQAAAPILFDQPAIEPEPVADLPGPTSDTELIRRQLKTLLAALADA